MVNVAFKDVALLMVTLVTRIPLPLTTTLGAGVESKTVPVRVIVAVDPLSAVLGEMEIRVGGGCITVNCFALLVPSRVVTVTS